MGLACCHQLDAAGKSRRLFFELPGLVSDIHFRQTDTLYLLTVGNLNPHDEPLGAAYGDGSQGKYQAANSGTESAGAHGRITIWTRTDAMTLSSASLVIILVA